MLHGETGDRCLLTRDRWTVIVALVASGADLPVGQGECSLDELGARGGSRFAVGHWWAQIAGALLAQRASGARQAIVQFDRRLLRDLTVCGERRAHGRRALLVPANLAPGARSPRGRHKGRQAPVHAR